MINVQLELKLSNGQIVKASCDWSSKNVPDFGKNFYTNIRLNTIYLSIMTSLLI